MHCLSTVNCHVSYSLSNNKGTCTSPFLPITSHTHTHPFNGPLSGTTRVSRYQKGKINLDFTEARDSEWQWHQLGHIKSAPRSRQITMPAPHRSVFYRPDALPVAQPTASKHWGQHNFTPKFKLYLVFCDTNPELSVSFTTVDCLWCHFCTVVLQTIASRHVAHLTYIPE